MNIARVGLLVVAVAAAGAAAFLVRTLTQKPAPATSTVQVAQVPTMQVLVAASSLEQGALVKPGDFRWQAWPAEAVSPSFLTDQTAPRALEETAGATLRARVELGEPITAPKLVRGENAGFLAAMLTPGMRAISTKIDEETAAGGFILPGDRVDVVMTRRVQRGAEGGGEDFESRTVLTDVRVLAIGQSYDDANGEKTAQGRTATLELASSEAELLALAGAMGSVTLVLRSAAVGDNITGSTGAKAAGIGKRGQEAIRVVRYSHASRVMPTATISGDGR